MKEGKKEVKWREGRRKERINQGNEKKEETEKCKKTEGRTDK